MGPTWPKPLPLASRCLPIFFEETLAKDTVRISGIHRTLRTTMENHCLTAIQCASGYQRILIHVVSALQIWVFNSIHRDNVTQLVSLLLGPRTSKLRFDTTSNVARRAFDEVAVSLNILMPHELSSGICKFLLQRQLAQRKFTVRLPQLCIFSL